MDNILVNVYVPYIEQSFDIYIPVNKKIVYIKKLIISAIIELTDGNYKVSGNINLSNKNTSKIYEEQEYIIDTDIVNGSKLILL